MSKTATMTDIQGGIYSDDKKRLLKAPDVRRFRIAEGCEEVDARAFDDCEDLVSLYFPLSMSDDAVEFTIENLPYAIGHICVWDRPYVDEVYDVNEYWYDEDKVTTDEFGVEYTNEGRRLLTATRPSLIGKDYRVPDGVLTICDGAFLGTNDYLELSVPRSIKVIGDYLFGREGGKIVIRD